MIPGPFDPGFDDIVCRILCIGNGQQTLFQIHLSGYAFDVTHRFFHSAFTVFTVHTLYLEDLLIFYVVQLFSPGFIVAAAAVSAAFFCVRAADAGFATLFRTLKIEDNAADDGRKYHDENEIHHSAFTSLDDQFALRAYSAFI